ncbi:MAG: hypothetical protein LBJ86_05450, partial [Spirochaetaceae bacterium]|nr:hypothetical protein [Spirochaetaceae bacterium]
ESLPDEILDEYILEKISAKFYSEAKIGEKIQVYIKNNLEGKTFIHTMKSNKDNKLLVVAHTKWQKTSSNRPVYASPPVGRLGRQNNSGIAALHSRAKLDCE